MPTNKSLAVWVLVLTAAAQFVLQLDFSIVNVALATIQRHLHFSAVGLQWVVSGYALTFGSLLLVGGRLGDVVGHRRALICGLVLFAATSLTGGLATSSAMLVTSRLVQGASAALVSPAALGILTHTYTTPGERARVLGIFQGSTAAGATAGIVAGGVLTQYVGWRWVLLVNPPIIAVLVPLMLRVLPKQSGHAEGEGMDLRGAATVATSIGALILGVTEGQQRGFTTAAPLVAFAAAAVLMAAFVIIERRAEHPMLPIDLLGEPLRRAALAAMLLVGAALAAYVYFIALYLQHVLHHSALSTGLALAPATLLSLVVATQLASRLIGLIGAPRVIVAALLLIGGGQLWLAQVSAHGTYVGDVLGGILLTAAGFGLALPAVSFAVTHGAAPHQRGVAGGLFVTAQQVGSAVGLGALATVAAARTSSTRSLVAGYRFSFLVAAALMALGLGVFALFLGARRRPASGEQAQPAASLQL